MPSGSAYAGPPERLAQYKSAIDRADTDAEVKGAKNPYTSRNGHMFSFLGPDGTMALRMSEQMTEEFRSTYDSGDVIRYGATMRGYSSVPAALLEATEELAGWVARAWEWIGTLPPKATKDPS